MNDTLDGPDTSWLLHAHIANTIHVNGHVEQPCTTTPHRGTINPFEHLRLTRFTGSNAIEAMRSSLPQSYGSGHGLLLASLDVEQAFDQLEARAAARAMLEQVAPAWATAADLRDHVDQHAWPTVAEESCDGSVVPGDGERQGAPGTPTKWNCATNAISRLLVKACGGVSPDDRRPALNLWYIFWFADSAYIRADDPIKLQTRCSALAESASVYRIPFSEDSFDILRSDGGEESVSLSDGRWFTPGPALKVLGVLVDAQGSTHISIKARAPVAIGV